MTRFTSTIHKIGINPLVDPPERVLKAIFKQAGFAKGPIPVRGKLNGSEFIQTLVKYNGAWRLYINGAMLKAAGLGVGDVAKVEIEFDPVPRRVEVPPKFARALALDPAAKKAFEDLTLSRQKDILRYLGSLKTNASLEKNIERIMRHLSGRA